MRWRFEDAELPDLADWRRSQVIAFDMAFHWKLGIPPPFGSLRGGTPYYNVRRRLRDLCMTTATLTSKGQITIPAEVRAALGVDAGDRVEFVEVAPGRYEFIAATRSVTALKGMFGKSRKAVSIEEMNAAIARRGAGAK
jgi:antitoxin PrlF